MFKTLEITKKLDYFRAKNYFKLILFKMAPIHFGVPLQNVSRQPAESPERTQQITPQSIFDDTF